MMVYSELGRLPLYISRNIRIVKYWIKLLNTDNCILKECYATLYDEWIKTHVLLTGLVKYETSFLLIVLDTCGIITM